MKTKLTTSLFIWLIIVSCGTKTDKTNGYYCMDPSVYLRIVNRELQKEYKIDSNKETEKQVNRNTLEIGNKLGLQDRLEVVGKNDVFVLLKDHKQTFSREHQARLINPTKNPVGKISKHIVDGILLQCR